MREKLAERGIWMSKCKDTLEENVNPFVSELGDQKQALGFFECSKICRFLRFFW